MGAFGVLSRPFTRRDLAHAIDELKRYGERAHRRLIIVEPDDEQRDDLVALTSGDGIDVTVCTSVGAITDVLAAGDVDCVVFGPTLKDEECSLSALSRDGTRPIPAVVMGPSAPSIEHTFLVRRAQTHAQVIEAITLFTHRSQASLSEDNRYLLQRLRESDPVFAGKKVLIVDDDVRNIFAVASLLERFDVEVVFAENGRRGIEVLEANADVDVVLMDIMMPEMDGYATMRTIRRRDRFATLPIIALTAKAMMGDREKCLQAGASDYVTKPVENDQLLAVLRVWLCSDGRIERGQPRAERAPLPP
jgi:CheY-like chemotaxis protein